MKKIKLLGSSLLFGLSIVLFFMPVEKANSAGVVFDKEAIDCGTYFGTKCTGSGEGCDPTKCRDQNFE